MVSMLLEMAFLCPKLVSRHRWETLMGRGRGVCIVDHCTKQSFHNSEKIFKKLRTNNTPIGKNRGSCHWRSHLVTYSDLSLKLQLNGRIWDEIRSPEKYVPYLSKVTKISYPFLRTRRASKLENR